jgi:hypothetical protein
MGEGTGVVVGARSGLVGKGVLIRKCLMGITSKVTGVLEGLWGMTDSIFGALPRLLFSEEPVLPVKRKGGTSVWQLKLPYNRVGRECLQLRSLQRHGSVRYL